MEYRIATIDDIEELMDIRLEMLRIVNNLKEDQDFSDELVTYSRKYFIDGNQETCLAYDNGVARKMVQMLIDNAKRKGVSEISLDATESGRPLYESLGFRTSEECMVMEI